MRVPRSRASSARPTGAVLPASDRVFALYYRLRWLLAGLVLLLCFGLMGAGMARVTAFSEGVDSLKDTPPESSQARVFDARLDIWFDEADPALATYYEIEDKFIAQDTVLIAFEEPADPWGVFGERSLATIARLTEAIRKVPYVRHVRSLTATPWIRWGQVEEGEEGLVISDLFEKAPASYSRLERLERMIAVLGAERAAALAGPDAVREVLGPDADFSDHIGEPRLIDGVVSSDGRIAALQVQLIRTKIPRERLEGIFGDDAHEMALAESFHSNESQWQALDEIERILAEDGSYDYRVTGMPSFLRNFMEVGMADMKWVGVMFAFLALVLFVIYRRFAPTGVALLVVFSAILGMNGAIFLMGDQLNNLTAIVPHIVVAVGIPEAVHLITSYCLLRPGFTDKRALIIEVLRRNAFPVFLTSVTTAVGFFTLVSSTLDPMVKFGYTGGLGTVLAYLATMTVVPAFLSLVPLPKTRPGAAAAAPTAVADAEASVPSWTDAVVRFSVRRRREVIAVSLGVLGVAAVGAWRVDLNSEFRDWFPDGNVVVEDLGWIEERLGGMGDLEIVFSAPPSSEDPEAVRARRARLEELELQRLLHADCAAQADTAAGEQAPPCPPPLAKAAVAELERLRADDAAFSRLRIAVSHDFLSSVARFDRRIREEMADPGSPLSILTNLESGLDVLRKIHQVQHQNRASYYRIPGEEDVPEAARSAKLAYDALGIDAYYIPGQDASSLAAQYYMQYESGAKPVENLSSLISPDRHVFRIAARIEQGPSSAHLAAFARLRAIAAEEFPELAGTDEEVARGEALASMDLTGKVYLFANMEASVTESFLRSAFLAVVTITLVIMIAFRSIRLGLISILPNVLPLVIPFGVFGLLGIYLDSPALVVASVALGVCVDDTIYLLTKFQGARRAGASSLEALLEAFRHSGIAMTFTTIVLVFGFGVMMFSAYHPNILIGILATSMIALAWAVELLLTPALLSFLQSNEE